MHKLLFICCSLFSAVPCLTIGAPKCKCKLKGGGEGREMLVENSAEIFTIYKCWLCNLNVSILKILSNWVHLKCDDSKEFYGTTSVVSCSVFLCRYRCVSPCFMIILYMKSIGTTDRDFLSLSSELALESAKCVDIGKCRLKRTGIMCLWNATELASLKSRHFDAWYTHPPDKLYCPPNLLAFF